jgi:UDP-glucose 4-epimerase
MRVVITGATGNIGTSTIAALVGDPAVEEVVGVARRRPLVTVPKVVWHAADVASSDLVPLFRGADVVVSLAWTIQPSRQPSVMARTNVEGSRRVFRAVAEAGVPALVYASSVGAYSPGPKDARVDESWPTGGISSSPYSAHKAGVERLLDDLEAEHPRIRVVRMRTGLVFKAGAAASVTRRFLGPWVPNALIRRGLIPLVPRNDRLAGQAMHADDAGRAYHLAVTGDVRGPFNVAAEPVLDPQGLAGVLRARPIGVSSRLLRAAAAGAHRLRVIRADPGWVDMALGAPLMDTTRAREVLGWTPTRSAPEAVEDLLDGLAAGAGMPTPPLAPRRGREALPIAPSPVPKA